MNEETAIVETGDRLGVNPFQELEKRLDQITTLTKKKMKNGKDFGQIPGCDKPSLWQPGAEKIKMLFNLSADPEIEDLSNAFEVRYRVRCKIYSNDNRFLGAVSGECSSAEEKYKWRSAVCNEEFDDTPEADRRVKYGRKRGGTGFWKQRQVAMNPFSQRNTILQMAQKRAFVAAIKNTTGASEIFTVDGDDGADSGRKETEHKESIKTPKQTKGNNKPSDVIADAAQNELITLIEGYGIAPLDVQQVLEENGASSIGEIKKTSYSAIKKKLSEMGQTRQAQQ